MGTLTALAGLGVSVVTALGLADLAQRHVAHGLSLIASALALRFASGVASDQWGERAAASVRERWRSQLLGHFLRPRREGEGSRGDLALAVERASNEPSLERLRASAVTAMLGLVVVFWSAGWLSTSIVVALVGLAAPLYWRAGLRSEALDVEYRQRRGVLESRQLELLRHAPELRALGAVDYGASEIAAISASEHALALRAIRVALGSSLVTEFLSGVSVGLVAMVVGFALLGGHIGLAHALIAVLTTGEVFAHVRRYGAEFHRLEQTSHSLELLMNSSSPDTAPTSRGLIEAIDLTTEASATPVSLVLGPSLRVLVTGPSGSGKTTLLHTLLGWRTARSGTLRRATMRLAYVSVDSPLLSGTLWDNLTLGADLDPARVRAQLRELGLEGARFDDFTAPLLADGRGLSSGERVRLVLARCLLADPEVVVIDDVAGTLDVAARDVVSRAIAARGDLAVIEASVDSPLLSEVDLTVEVRL